jgi:hypothetical protein
VASKNTDLNKKVHIYGHPIVVCCATRSDAVFEHFFSLVHAAAARSENMHKNAKPL